MTAPDITPEDTAAMRASGKDFREYLRSEMDRGRARKQAPVKPAPQPRPGHRPGAWPVGTRPPDPPPPMPAAEVDRAVAEYRQWNAAGQPACQPRCECPSCQQLPGSHE